VKQKCSKHTKKVGLLYTLNKSNQIFPKNVLRYEQCCSCRLYQRSDVIICDCSQCACAVSVRRMSMRLKRHGGVIGNNARRYRDWFIHRRETER